MFETILTKELMDAHKRLRTAQIQFSDTAADLAKISDDIEEEHTTNHYNHPAAGIFEAIANAEKAYDDLNEIIEVLYNEVERRGGPGGYGGRI